MKTRASRKGIAIAARDPRCGRDSSSVAGRSELPGPHGHGRVPMPGAANRNPITTEVTVRKLIESTLISADGVVGDPQLWAMEYRDAEVEKDALERLGDADAMLLGRGTYQVFAATWPGQVGEFADRMNSIRKYVFSSTLDKADWNNTVIVSGDVTAEVSRLKQQDGQSLALYGHGLLAQTLLEHGLVDELRLSIHPVLAGRGQLMFRESAKTPLKLFAAKTLGTGVVVLSYQPVRS
jgi:dihydrofolate reductase